MDTWEPVHRGWGGLSEGLLWVRQQAAQRVAPRRAGGRGGQGHHPGHQGGAVALGSWPLSRPQHPAPSVSLLVW